MMHKRKVGRIREIKKARTGGEDRESEGKIWVEMIKGRKVSQKIGMR